MCLELGIAHPDILLDSLTAEQWYDWQIYNRIQPIGKGRLDFYFAFLMQTLHNLALSIHGKKGAKQFDLEAFIPNWTGIEMDSEPDVMSMDEMKDFWKGFAKEHNPKVSAEYKRQHRRPRSFNVKK